MKLSVDQLTDLARRHGFPDPAFAAAVAMAESTGDTTRVADTLMKVIADAMKARDFEAVVAGIKILATVDPQMAQDVYDTIQAGIMIGRADT